jgi:hypothetical protein
MLPLLTLALAAPPDRFDVVVYGGTAGGIAAAVQAAKMGKAVVVVEPGRHLGGLTSGGLGYTDSGDKTVVGGLAREFYRKVKAHYDRPAAWVHERPDGFKGYRKADDAMWVFEPKVAERTLRDWLAEAKVPVVYGERLDRRPGGVTLAGNRIAAFRTESGKAFAGGMFLDATYEGDLMAAAGVSFAVGREANRQYGETLNGVARRWQTHTHRFLKPVDPFVVPGDPTSGLLPGVERELPADGEGDRRLQAYCFRMCMSDVPANRVPFPRPAGYDERRYELLFRNFAAGDMRLPLKIDRMPNGKTDTNNNGAVSTDHIGANYAYPEASYAERERIVADHVAYQQGLMWTLANHPRVPAEVRGKMSKWGLAADEFTDSGNWGHQLYVREARRLVGDHVQTEADCRRTRPTPESVGMGSYNMDSHNCARFVTPQGTVQNEGDVQESPGGAYRISYRAIVPKRGECPNLLVPVCVSSTHIAYGSIRMEPVFMVLGQSAATAAVLALDGNLAVQDVDYAKLRVRLLADGQVLEKDVPPRPSGTDPKSLPGVVIDDDAANLTGDWAASSSVGPFVGTGYRHDGGTKAGTASAAFTATLPAGKYEVRLSYTANPNRATAVPVTVAHADGTSVVKVNQRTKPPANGWLSLGTFRFAAGPATLTISTAGADGYVVIDAVHWKPAGD